MPKIPLYAEGAGSLVEMPAGQLGPRAAATPFAQSAQAKAQLGEQIARAGLAYGAGKLEFDQQKAKIDFDFAMAERAEEDRRIVREEATAAQIAIGDFVMNNTSSDTEGFLKLYEEQATSITEGINSKGYSKRRAALVLDEVSRAILAGRLDGQEQAFNRGKALRTTAANEALDQNLRSMSMYPGNHPEHQRLLKESLDIIENAQDTGLNIDYTQNSFGVTANIASYQTMLNAATSKKQTNQIRERLATDKNLSLSQSQSLLKDIMATEGRIEAEQFESKSAQVRTISDNVENIADLDDINDALVDNKPREIKLANGDTVEFDPSDLSESNKRSIASLVGALQQTTRGEIYQSSVDTVQNLSGLATKQELSQAAKTVAKTGSATVTLIDGSQITINAAQLEPTQRGAISQLVEQVANETPNKIKGRQIANNMGIFSSGTPYQDMAARLGALYSPENLAKNGQTIDDVDAVLIGSARNMLTSVQESIDAGVYDPAQISNMLNAATLSLTTAYADGVSISDRGTAASDEARAVRNAISTVRAALVKDVQGRAKINAGVTTAMDGNFVTSGISTNYKPEEMKKVTAGVVRKSVEQAAEENKNPLSVVFGNLERNSLVYEEFTNQIQNAYDIAEAGSLDPDSDAYQNVVAQLEFYRAMSMYPAVLRGHVSDDARAFFDSVISRSNYVPLPQALENAARAKQLGLDTEPKMKQLEDAFAALEEETETNFFKSLVRDAPVSIQNKSMAIDALRRRTEDYISLGNGPKEAMELAGADVLRTHVLVRGYFMRRGINTPANINELADAGVDKVLQDFKSQPVGIPILDQEIDPDELSFMVSNDGKVFTLTTNGVNVVQGVVLEELEQVPGEVSEKKAVSVRPIVFSLDELQRILYGVKYSEIAAEHRKTMDNERGLAAVTKADKEAEEQAMQVLRDILAREYQPEASQGQ